MSSFSKNTGRKSEEPFGEELLEDEAIKLIVEPRLRRDDTDGHQSRISGKEFIRELGFPGIAESLPE